MAAGRSRLPLTPASAGWLLLDACGMLLFAAGTLYFARGDAFFIHWPTANWQAGLTILAGVALMLVAAAQLLRLSLQLPSGRDRSAD